ncbi:MAG: hypothetical protein AB3N21_04905 [Ruegeria sp.]|uniref:hypothetical protein n=1 Tax=Ruegeria sp. TaxID=1879320 RepID=UPI00349EA40B
MSATDIRDAVQEDEHGMKQHLTLRMIRVGAVALMLGLLAAAIYGRMMSFGLRRDEMMFVTPAELLGQWQLYRDFFYNHVPNSAWFFRGFHLLFEDQGLLGSARLGVFFAWLLLVSGLGWVTYRISHSVVLGLFFPVALMACEPLLTQAGMAATNNLLPLPFAVLGLGLFISETLGNRPRKIMLVIAGICLSIAAGMKVSAIMFIPPIAIGAFFLPREMSSEYRINKVVVPLVLGGLIGAVPLFWYLGADPQLFLAHVVKFHTGPHVEYWQANAAFEPGLAMGLAGKVQLAYGAWLSGVGLVMTMVLFFLIWVALRDTSSGDVLEESYRGQILVVLGVLALTAGMSLVPTPGFPQYYIQPLVCLPILCAIVYRRLLHVHRREVMPIFGAGLLVLVLLGLPRLAPGLLALTEPGKFTTAKVARGGEALRQVLAENGNSVGPVATLFPLYPLEAGLPVYGEFATGPFAYRIAPFTNPVLANEYQMVGEDGLTALFDTNPPSAFLLGYDLVLEAPLQRYAEANGYQPVEVAGLKNRYGQGIVYMKNPEVSQ